jgi:hypothetical protein
LQHSLETLVMLIPILAISATVKWCGERTQDVLVVRSEGRAQQAAYVLGDDSLRPSLPNATEKFGPKVARVVVTLVHPSDAPWLARHAPCHDTNRTMPGGEVHFTDISLN